MTAGSDRFRTEIWDEQAEPGDPFAAQRCLLHGYDVYGELLGRVSFTEYLYLLFSGKKPSDTETSLMNTLCVSLAHPGIRSYLVRAAMNSGVGGSTYYSCLTSALAANSGNYCGAHEVLVCMELWYKLGQDLEGWVDALTSPRTVGETEDIWMPLEHPAGFDPNGVSCPLPLRQMLSQLAGISAGRCLPWLLAQREALESVAAMPLSVSGIAAATLVDLGFAPQSGEMFYLWIRLPGAAVHALEAKRWGPRDFPLFKDKLKSRDETL